MKLKEGIIQNEINGAFYLIDCGIQGKRFNGMVKLNQTGAEVAELLMNDTNEDEIIKEICEKYQITPEEFKPDLDNFIKTLKDNGLIEND